MINYNKLMEEQFEALGSKPSILLHSCCAPCSTHVLSCLIPKADVTVFYYNPNIYPEEEYYHRLSEQKRLLEMLSIPLIEGEYDPQQFYEKVRGYEQAPEGGERCALCFELRLEETAKMAKQQGFEYIATTLTVSPHKNAEVINSVGIRTAEKYGVKWLFSDFKKKDGYRHSVALSQEYGLYRQDYCGCVFAKEQMKTERDA